MPSTELLNEAEWVMRVCNACRYCEGFCAVFPAMTRRRTFSDQDLVYLANLCHNCRGCYYACQYRPPHEFDLNIPKTFQELRVETYQDYTWPGFLAGLFQRNGLAVALITVVSTVIVVLLTLLFQGNSMFSTYIGEGAFYEVIPHDLIVWVAVLIFLWVIAAFVIGVLRFWRDTGGKPGELFNPMAHVRAIGDVLRLRYLDGGGHGCNYPDEQFSQSRRWLHHLVFYGFMLSFASTSVATIYENVFHWIAPYPFWSLPVLLGTIGGIGLVIGSGGLLLVKTQSDQAPANRHLFGMDIAFLVLLFLTGLTGLLLLALRATPGMGMLLAIHLGAVVALFLTLPYGKFVHAVYRYFALVRNALEEAHEAA